MDTLRYYLKRILPVFIIIIALELIELSSLIYMEWGNLDFSFLEILKSSFIFLEQLLIPIFYWLLPYTLYLLILPQKKHGSRLDHTFTGIGFILLTIICLFEEIGELLFWDEFESTFNFIAVDYLIYTKEVIGNIEESYPMGTILTVILLTTGIIYFFSRKKLIPTRIPTGINLRTRALYFIANILICTISYFAADQQDADIINNRYNKEVVKGGEFSLFSAFIHNEIDYKDFYITSDDPTLNTELRAELAQANATFTDDAPDSIRRTITGTGTTARPNVIIVVMESMGAEFMDENRNGQSSITPNLTALAAQGIYFPHTYATGTRSVRGLEAVSTSIPPLPGMAILRRAGNEGVETVGSIFREQGYTTKWIYGGYGYFDNMNAYFAGNGFDVLDRTDIPESEITHSTIWGICDEDLFGQVIKDADTSAATGTPFMRFVFTTSNHRPYTYPEGKIDIPSKSGREGAVKYADYSIGQLIAQAKTKPWFNNTVFLFIADHTAGSAGKQDLNPEKHIIPLIIYAPALIKPARHEQVISQIDAVPTLLGLLGFTYQTSAYGKDALRPEYHSRYFISNYQKIGYGKDGNLLILQPVRAYTYLSGPNATPQTLDEMRRQAVMYYQHAAGWQTHLKQQ